MHEELGISRAGRASEVHFSRKPVAHLPLVAELHAPSIREGQDSHRNGGGGGAGCPHEGDDLSLHQDTAAMLEDGQACRAGLSCQLQLLQMLSGAPGFQTGTLGERSHK